MKYNPWFWLHIIPYPSKELLPFVGTGVKVSPKLSRNAIIDSSASLRIRQPWHQRISEKLGCDSDSELLTKYWRWLKWEHLEEKILDTYMKTIESHGANK